MTTVKQEKEFVAMLGNELPKSLLGDTLDWIRDNLDPGDIYDQQRLNQYVGQLAAPEEVFSEDELKAWAIDKGYIAPKKPTLLSYEQPESTPHIITSLMSHFK
jgi:hypothetical protein